MTKFIDSLKKLWQRALLLTHEGHWLQSEVAVQAFDRAKGDKDKAYAILGQIGVPANTKAKLYSMNAARAVIRERDVWLAAGWSGVSRLVSMPEGERKKSLAQLQKAMERGEKPRRAAARILPAPERPKANGPNGSDAPETPTAPAKADPSLMDKLVEFLRSATELQPALLKLAPPEVKALLAKKKRPA